MTNATLAELLLENVTSCVNNQTLTPVHQLVFKTTFSILFPLVFTVAVFGNGLVIYVVLTNKEMQTVTNIFITNLAITDLLVNCSCLWLTPIYIYLDRWVFGEVMCHLLPLFQGVAIFNSTLTLSAIAVDRCTVIVYPHKPRISPKIGFSVVASIWMLSVMIVFPYCLNMTVILVGNVACERYVCREYWSWPPLRTAYGFVVAALQFGVPLLIIAFCYLRIWCYITRRQTTAYTSNTNAEGQRKRRLLKMLIAMVVIFTACWLPFNLLNIARDLGLNDKSPWFDEHFSLFFLFAYVACMSATCWNPILYAGMNENFQREFKAVLPCFPSARARINRATSAAALGRIMANDNRTALINWRRRAFSADVVTSRSPNLYAPQRHLSVNVMNSGRSRGVYASPTRQHIQMRMINGDCSNKSMFSDSSNVRISIKEEAEPVEEIACFLPHSNANDKTNSSKFY